MTDKYGKPQRAHWCRPKVSCTDIVRAAFCLYGNMQSFPAYVKIILLSPYKERTIRGKGKGSRRDYKIS
jgi:hypothetical protein